MQHEESGVYPLEGVDVAVEYLVGKLLGGAAVPEFFVRRYQRKYVLLPRFDLVAHFEEQVIPAAEFRFFRIDEHDAFASDVAESQRIEILGIGHTCIVHHSFGADYLVEKAENLALGVVFEMRKVEYEEFRRMRVHKLVDLKNSST